MESPEQAARDNTVAARNWNARRVMTGGNITEVGCGAGLITGRGNSEGRRDTN